MTQKRFLVQELDEVEVLESPDGDLRKRGEIRVAHTLDGEHGYVQGPVEVSEAISPRVDAGQLLTAGMMAQMPKNQRAFLDGDMSPMGSLLYPSEDEVRAVIEATREFN